MYVRAVDVHFGNRKCKECGQAFKSEERFDAHMWVTHNKKDCRECGHWSMSVQDEAEHLKRHQKTVTIEICGRKQRIQRSKDNFFDCIITHCDFRTENPDEARRHHDAMHQLVITMNLPPNVLPEPGSEYVPLEHSPTPTPTTSRVSAARTPSQEAPISPELLSRARVPSDERS
ncbi:hypothetical protein BD410DRAFT_810647, partial [Rickenella mellea]